MKIFIISDEIRENHQEFKNQKWICDLLKEEFIHQFPNETTINISEATIIWYLAPWNYRFTPNECSRDSWLQMLKKKQVIFTQHHIDDDKYKNGQLDAQFEFMKTYGNHFHTICDKTYTALSNIFETKNNISVKKLWINDENFYNIQNKSMLRQQFNFSPNAYLVGSFQKDTEGKTNLPKWSKGPDLFIEIVKNMYEKNNKLEVVLSGLRREYIIDELTKLNIPYHYFNMITIDELNKLYNSLDLYIVSSRCEGGPRAIVECGLTKTPIISTKVGIAPELMDEKALFDYENIMSYKEAQPNSETLSRNTLNIASKEYMMEFRNYIIHNEECYKKHIFVGTTAVNRSDLHNENIEGWFNYINSIDKNKYEIEWVINVDFIEKLEESVSTTKDNFRRLIKDNDIKLTLLNNDEKHGNFLRACKRISSYIETQVMEKFLNYDDVIIIWLEDDWKLSQQNIPLERLIEQYMSNLTYINLSFIRNNYIHALAPSIISYPLWSKIHLEAWKQQNEHIDPEHCIGAYYKKTFGDYDDIVNITLINQYKKHDESFFQHKMFNFDTSYYTYDIQNESNFILDKYIENHNVQTFLKDKIAFIRVTCSSCVDYGRDFMKEYDIIKRRVQDDKTKDFYK